MSIKKNINCQALTGRAGSSHFCEMEPTSNTYFTFKYMHQLEILKGNLQGFPGGTVVGSPPASAGDMGSGPGPGGSHMPRHNWARAPQLLSLRSRAHEPQMLSPSATTAGAHAPRAHAPQQDRPPQ